MLPRCPLPALSLTLRGYKPNSQIAHVIYDGVRTLFTEEAKQSLHREIVAVGPVLPAVFQWIGEEAGLKSMLKTWKCMLSDLGIDSKEGRTLMRLSAVFNRAISIAD